MADLHDANASRSMVPSDTLSLQKEQQQQLHSTTSLTSEATSTTATETPLDEESPQLAEYSIQGMKDPHPDPNPAEAVGLGLTPTNPSPSITILPDESAATSASALPPAISPPLTSSGSILNAEAPAFVPRGRQPVVVALAHAPRGDHHHHHHPQVAPAPPPLLPLPLPLHPPPSLGSSFTGLPYPHVYTSHPSHPSRHSPLSHPHLPHPHFVPVPAQPLAFMDLRPPHGISTGVEIIPEAEAGREFQTHGPGTTSESSAEGSKGGAVGGKGKGAGGGGGGGGGGAEAFLKLSEGEKEELQRKMVKQVEYYFSDQNLPSDNHLLRLMRKDAHGFVPLKNILEFKKMKAMTPPKAGIAASITFLAAAIKAHSTSLVTSEDGKKLRRHDMDVEEIKTKTVVAENLPDSYTAQSLKALFSKVGTVHMVKVVNPETGSAGGGGARLESHHLGEVIVTNKVHAIVQFDSVAEADRAVNELSDSNSWRRGLNVRHLVKPFSKKASAHHQHHHSNHQREKTKKADEETGGGGGGSGGNRSDGTGGGESTDGATAATDGINAASSLSSTPPSDSSFSDHPEASLGSVGSTSGADAGTSGGGGHARKGRHGGKKGGKGGKGVVAREGGAMGVGGSPGTTPPRLRAHGHGHGDGHVGTPPKAAIYGSPLGQGWTHGESGSKPPKGPRMPDGTRGFTMGRGKALPPQMITTSLVQRG